jgi:restriction system protein
MNPVLQVFANPKNANGYGVRDIEKDVISILGIKEEGNFRLKNGNFITYDRSCWALTYLKKAGLLERIGWGLYKITNEGLKALKSGEKINTEFLLKNYEPFREFKTESKRKKEMVIATLRMRVSRAE